MPRLTDDPVYLSSHFLALWGFTLGWGLRVWHRERLPPAGPMLLVCNHLSHMDPPLVGLAVGRPCTYLARHNLFHVPGLRWLIRRLGAVPIDRDAGKDGLAAVLRLLAEGKPVIMFPEGTRSPDGELQPLKPGVALLVKKAKCPVVPVGLVGAWESWPKGQILPVPAPLGVLGPGRPLGLSFGEPVPVGHYDRMGREDIVADLERRLAEAVADVRKRRR
ncbi:MAG: 1-acyl-sn-glycerol-3-phosphate acyltransferase [Fimbriiglobus sp.]|jgi:1-acyl-sn-glycerol-3-phosphate acyltransferase|nr:1-acyl-sn-glycerol-3-phosphate acyltransferase [Fimbriiglobus sp.]